MATASEVTLFRDIAPTEQIRVLHQAFRTVEHRTKGKFLLKATEHMRLMVAAPPCTHERRLKATDISACINKDGYLVSGDVPIRYEEVIFCQRCEKVSSSVVAVSA